MESFVIEGGQPLHGKVRAAGNKNGVLPILAACVLTSEPVELHNVPRIRDVDTMLALLADIGVEVDWTGPERRPGARSGDPEDRARSRALLADARLVPARGPAARPRGKRRRRAPGRGRDRAPQARPAHPRLRRARSRRRRGRHVRHAHRPHPRCERLPRRGERDGDREHRHGRGAGRRARRPSETPRASRTSRISAASSARSGRRSRGSSRTSCASAASRACAGARGRSARITSRWRASSGSRR